MSKNSPDQKDPSKDTLPDGIAAVTPGSDITEKDRLESLNLVMGILRHARCEATASTIIVFTEREQQEEAINSRTDGIPVEGTPYCIKKVDIVPPNDDGDIDPTLIRLKAVIGHSKDE